MNRSQRNKNPSTSSAVPPYSFQIQECRTVMGAKAKVITPQVPHTRLFTETLGMARLIITNLCMKVRKNQIEFGDLHHEMNVQF